MNTPLPPSTRKWMGEEILGQTPPLTRGRVMEMLPLPLDIVAGDHEVWNSCRSSRDEGSQAEDKVAQRSRYRWPLDQITTEHNTESAHFLFPSFFSLVESFESDLLLLNRSIITNRKALRTFPPGLHFFCLHLGA